MPDPDHKALCAELRHFVAEYQQMRGLDPENIYSIHEGIPGREAHLRVSRLTLAADLLERLAQPEPVAPTDEELRALWRLGWQSKDPEDGAVLFAEEVLARWGTPAIQPEPEPPAAIVEMVNKLHQINNPAIQPVPVSERLPEKGDCDAEGRCWWVCPPDFMELRSHATAISAFVAGATHWLPHWALPVPASQEDYES